MLIVSVLLDLVLKFRKTYYPQFFVEQCKCKEKEKEITNFIPREIQSSSDADDNSHSDKELL